MRFFYDTEFLEDGKTIELISIGIVADDDREFYAVAEEAGDGPLYERIRRDEWLMTNVVPHLPLKPGTTPTMPFGQNPGRFQLDFHSNVVMPRRMIRNAVRDFILGTDGKIDPDIQLWADYAAYDHVVLSQLFGRMIDLPQGMPMFTNDIQQAWNARGCPALPEPVGEHNALADARTVRARFEAIYKPRPSH